MSALLRQSLSAGNTDAIGTGEGFGGLRNSPRTCVPPVLNNAAQSLRDGRLRLGKVAEYAERRERPRHQVEDVHREGEVQRDDATRAGVIIVDGEAHDREQQEDTGDAEI